jgi:hypothetical protein
MTGVTALSRRNMQDQLPSTLKELRKYAKSLGIKGISKYDHFNLISKVLLHLELLKQKEGN